MKTMYKSVMIEMLKHSLRNSESRRSRELLLEIEKDKSLPYVVSIVDFPNDKYSVGHIKIVNNILGYTVQY